MWRGKIALEGPPTEIGAERKGEERRRGGGARADWRNEGPTKRTTA